VDRVQKRGGEKDLKKKTGRSQKKEKAKEVLTRKNHKGLVDREGGFKGRRKDDREENRSKKNQQHSDRGQQIERSIKEKKENRKRGRIPTKKNIKGGEKTIDHFTRKTKKRKSTLRRA